MKTGPFKMKGFGGFGNSPVKNDRYEKISKQAMEDSFDKKRTDEFIPDTGPDRPGSKGMYPTGFETKIPRINKLKKL